jgi:hypothetical protein
VGNAYRRALGCGRAEQNLYRTKRRKREMDLLPDERADECKGWGCKSTERFGFPLDAPYSYKEERYRNVYSFHTALNKIRKDLHSTAEKVTLQVLEECRCRGCDRGVSAHGPESYDDCSKHHKRSGGPVVAIR